MFVRMIPTILFFVITVADAACPGNDSAPCLPIDPSGRSEAIIVVHANELSPETVRAIAIAADAVLQREHRGKPTGIKVVTVINSQDGVCVPVDERFH